MRTSAQALAAYNAQTTNRRNYCLWEVQEAYQAPHLYPGAVGQPGQSSQWNNALERVRDRNMPAGAPVYWFNPYGWGHVALYAGNGMVRSSDAGGPGRMGTVSIDWITRSWYPAGHFLGWTRDIGGRWIEFGFTGVVVRVWLLRYGVTDSESVRHFQRRLIALGYNIPAGPTGSYWDQTAAAAKAIQRAWNQAPQYATGRWFSPLQTEKLFRGTGATILQ